MSKIEAVPVAAMSFAAADDGVIDLPCDAWLTAPLTIGGATLPSGFYAGSAVKAGVVVQKNLGAQTMFKVQGHTEDVTPVPVSWQGGNGSFSESANWQGTPDFTTGTARPTFSSEVEATVDGAYKVAGLSFGAAGTYKLAAGAGALLEFSQGVTVIPAGATVVVDSPVRFADGHRFEMGFKSVLKFLGKVSGDSVESVSFVSSETKTARDDARPLGVVYFVNGESDFVQDLAFSNTCAYAKGTRPFGVGLGSVTIRNEEHFITNDRLLILDGATIDNAVKHDNYEADQKQTIYAFANTTNVFNGVFDMCERRLGSRRRGKAYAAARTVSGLRHRADLLRGETGASIRAIFLKTSTLRVDFEEIQNLTRMRPSGGVFERRVPRDPRRGRAAWARADSPDADVRTCRIRASTQRRSFKIQRCTRFFTCWAIGNEIWYNRQTNRLNGRECEYQGRSDNVQEEGRRGKEARGGG